MQLRVLLRYPGILCALVVADIVTVVVQSRPVSRIATLIDSSVQSNQQSQARRDRN